MKFNFHAASIREDFDPVDMFRSFETAEQARRARQRVAKALQDYGPDGRELAGRLNKCSMRYCRSAACPICLRYFRRWWSSQIAEYMALDRDGWFTVCVVPSELALPVGKLDRFQWNLAKDRLRKQIERSKLEGATILGGFDYALQAFQRRPPEWRPHIYFLTQTGGKGIIEAALRQHYRQDEDTPKPVVVTHQRKSDEDLISTASYTFKSDFRKRQPILDRRGNADTNYLPLESHHEAELALLLHRQGFLGRLIRRQGRGESIRAINTR